MLTVHSRKQHKVPDVIGIRPDDLTPLVQKWKKQNPRVGFSHLLREALLGRSPLPEIAGKRYEHLFKKS